MQKNSYIVGFLLSLVVLIPNLSSAGIIDTRPLDSYAVYYVTTGSSEPDSAGMTFIADDLFLNYFTLEIFDEVGGGFFRAIVMDTNISGDPNSVLWESAAIPILTSSTEYTFNPNQTLTIGETYYIGFDTGLYTTTSGGDIKVGKISSDVYSGGKWYRNFGDGSGWSGFDIWDLATRIEMGPDPVPEPTTMLLLGTGLVGIAGAARRKKKNQA